MHLQVFSNHKHLLLASAPILNYGVVCEISNISRIFSDILESIALGTVTDAIAIMSLCPKLFFF